MKIYVGVTDDDWFDFLAQHQPDEVNFWRPKNQNNFTAIPVGAPFLFKLHHPLNFIVGGGFLIRHTFLPLSLAWQAFGEKNGVPDYKTFEKRLLKFRKPFELNGNLGCTILGEPFFFPKDRWIPIPEDWSRNIVTGKTYDTETSVGLALWNAVQMRLSGAGVLEPLQLGPARIAQEEPVFADRFGIPRLIRPRLGQGGFRVLVTDAYTRRCAMTGERTLPALEAAHIKPYADEGPHQINNGLLLRSDLHHLFDQGYMTVTGDYKVEVSRRIREEFENGRDYYALHGKELMILPHSDSDRPSPEYLEWHQNSRFLG